MEVLEGKVNKAMVNIVIGADMPSDPLAAGQARISCF